MYVGLAKNICTKHKTKAIEKENKQKKKKKKKKKKKTTENSKDPVHRGCPIFKNKNNPQGTKKKKTMLF